MCIRDSLRRGVGQKGDEGRQGFACVTKGFIRSGNQSLHRLRICAEIDALAGGALADGGH